jgi:hypothetical protein
LVGANHARARDSRARAPRVAPTTTAATGTTAAEYLNVLGAILYLSSSGYYAESEPYYAVYDYSADVLMKIHRIELAAAILEMVASIGWAWS